MPTWDVRLLKTSEVKFPPVCIGCSGTPTTQLKIRRDAVGWWSIVRLGWLYGVATGRAYEVPACAACARRLNRQRWRTLLSEWVIVLVGAIIGMWIFHDWEGLARRFAVIGTALLVAVPYFVWDYMFPAAVDITVTESAVTFHFADPDYANRFADENGVVL